MCCCKGVYARRNLFYFFIWLYLFVSLKDIIKTNAIGMNCSIKINPPILLKPSFTLDLWQINC